MYRKINYRVLSRTYSQSTQGSSKPPAGQVSSPPPSSATAGTDLSKVSGLSNKVVKPFSGPVGPGATPTADYKVPEYYCFHRMSYHEAEIELEKHRLPQPAAERKD